MQWMSVVAGECTGRGVKNAKKCVSAAYWLVEVHIQRALFHRCSVLVGRGAYLACTVSPAGGRIRGAVNQRIAMCGDFVG